MNASTKTEWKLPTALIVLTAVPLIAGLVRLAGLASGAAITPENARFIAAPLPVAIHIPSAILYCILSAFQFVPGFRRRKPGWHRNAGNVLVVAGMVSALSGLWMAQFYPIADLQGPLLYGFRLLFGFGMVLSIVLGWFAIQRRDITHHRAWMIRA